VHDWLQTHNDEVPSPTLVAAWLTLNTLPTEYVPRWAAFWIVAGHDGSALVDLAGLHGDDPHEVRDVLPAALADCGVVIPGTDTAAGMEVFTHLARLYAEGKAGERWIAAKVDEIVAASGYSADVLDLPLGQIYGLDDEWEAGWGRPEAKLREATREACRDQLHLAADA
jgi:hypothetical protein